MPGTIARTVWNMLDRLTITRAAIAAGAIVAIGAIVVHDPRIVDQDVDGPEVASRIGRRPATTASASPIDGDRHRASTRVPEPPRRRYRFVVAGDTLSQAVVGLTSKGLGVEIGDGNVSASVGQRDRDRPPDAALRTQSRRQFFR